MEGNRKREGSGGGGGGERGVKFQFEHNNGEFFFISYRVLEHLIIMMWC